MMNTLKRILLVEDSEPDIELTLSPLESNHLANTVDVTRDGAEAFDDLFRRGAFASRGPDSSVVVILDLKLPNVNGLEVLRELKGDARTRSIPVVVLTSSREEPDLRECYRLGVNAYVVKPVDFEQFVEAVKNVGLFWAMINEPPPAAAGATVRLELTDRAPPVAMTGDDGRYVLDVPRAPDHVALSASREGYTPATRSVPTARLPGNTLTVDFGLRPADVGMIAIEEQPEVHHLGNDRWEGRINSQFQKSAEGEVFTADFEIAAEHLPPHFRRAEVWLLCKGVQCPHEIRIHGLLIDARLDRAPRDGSFGELRARFDIALLYEGMNSLRIDAVACRGDLDDFEVVNLQIGLAK